MKKSKAIDVLNLIDESRAAKWKLAVDEDSHKLKLGLEKLGFRVLMFSKGLSDEDIHKELIKNRVNFFITQNGKDFISKLGNARTCYSLLWVDQKLIADIQLTIKTIEGAIIYDKRLTPLTYAHINGAYVTELPKIKKQAQRS